MRTEYGVLLQTMGTHVLVGKFPTLRQWVYAAADLADESIVHNNFLLKIIVAPGTFPEAFYRYSIYLYSG